MYVSACIPGIRESKRSGFTLIELLVTVTVVLLISSVVIANFNSYSESQKVKQAALNLKSNLRLIQARAISGVKPTSGCTTLLGYQMSFESTGYSYQPLCSEGLVGAENTISLASGLSFSPSVPSDMTFRVLKGTLDADAQITISGAERHFRIEINRSGDMSEVGFVSQ